MPVDVSCGRVVDRTALAQALETRLKDDALDVFGAEPRPWDRPFWVLMAVFCDNRARFRASEPLRDVGDPDRGY